MKKITLLFFSLLCFTLSAQQIINNKGNRNQSYPIITEKNPEIVQLINQVNQDSLEARIRYMQGFIRNAEFPAALTVQNWLINHFESYGYENVSVHYFNYQSQQLDAGNVVVVKEGSDPALRDEYILITSHYDHPSGPGADDNASGTAGVLECARLLKDFSAKRSIMFVPFNAEELWMVGSMPFAKMCASENKNIIAVLNMDMIGWFPPQYAENTVMASGYSYISKNLFEYYQQTANLYNTNDIPTIRFSSGDSYGGDHMPFNIYEYPALYIGDIEYHDLHPCYHKPCDTIGEFGGVNRLDLAKAFVQATIAAVAELANAWLPPQNLSACAGIDKITVSWDNDSDASSYKLFKNNLLFKEITTNYYVDNEVETGKKYEYYVIAVNQETGKESAPSNKEEITFVKPLQLPYSNGFSENKQGFEQSNWVIRNKEGKYSICNNEGHGYLQDNYLSMAELDWFPIPADVENILIRFNLQDTIRGIWYDNSEKWYNANLFFEVTNDRKTWHKLACFSGYNNGWKSYQFSLNSYIGSEFFQARFRLESSGAEDRYYTKIAYITDVEVVFESDTTGVEENASYISSFHFFPNPASTYINIVTDQQDPYHIAIYDLSGRIVFAQDRFIDGELNVSHLQKGTYLVVVSTKHHRVGLKLIL